VPTFLSDEWFTTSNAVLAQASKQGTESQVQSAHVVLELDDGPNDKPHAMTFEIKDGLASVASGDHFMADTIIRLSFADAQALVEGTLTSADVLREGRIKVRGDVHAIVSLASWLAALREITTS
jgi:putative sterol carrier protein